VDHNAGSAPGGLFCQRDQPRAVSHHVTQHGAKVYGGDLHRLRRRREYTGQNENRGKNDSAHGKPPQRVMTDV
jgi:hypothetical protein